MITKGFTPENRAKVFAIMEIRFQPSCPARRIVSSTGSQAAISMSSVTAPSGGLIGPVAASGDLRVVRGDDHHHLVLAAQPGQQVQDRGGGVRVQVPVSSIGPGAGPAC